MKYLISPFVALLCLMLSTPSNAHPHSWISLQSEPIIHQDNWFGIKTSWYFDPMTSSQMVMGLNLTGQVPQSQLEALIPDLKSSIEMQAFFSEITVGDRTINPAEMTDTSISQRNAEIGFHFTLRFPAGLSIREPLQWKTFEEEYYVDMGYRGTEDLSINEAHSECKIALTEPVIDEALLNYAQALDQDSFTQEALDQKALPDVSRLGHYFAQHIAVTCNVEDKLSVE